MAQTSSPLILYVWIRLINPRHFHPTKALKTDLDSFFPSVSTVHNAVAPKSTFTVSSLMRPGVTVSLLRVLHGTQKHICGLKTLAFIAFKRGSAAGECVLK